MTPLKRTLMIWSILMVLFLLCIAWLNRFGDRVTEVLEVRSKVTRGLDLESSKRIEEAILQYESAVAADEKALRPRVLLTQAYIQIGRFTDAMSQARAAVEVTVGKDHRDALLLLARVYREAGMWYKAQNILEKAINASPDSAEAHHGMAMAAEAMRDYPRMVKELAKVARLADQKSSAEYQAARLRRQEEIRLLTNQVKEQKDSPEPYFKLGILYKETGYWQDAVDMFNKVAGLRTVADAYFWLGVNAEAVGARDRAITMYRQAITACPNHLNALMSLKRTLLLIRTEEQPTDSQAWYELGLLNAELGNWKETHGAFSRTVSVAPGFADAHFRLGHTLEMLGRADEARAAYAEAVRLLPTHLQALKALHESSPG